MIWGLNLGSSQKQHFLNLLSLRFRREDLVENPSVVNKCYGFVMGFGGCVGLRAFLGFFFCLGLVSFNSLLFPPSPSISRQMF